MCVRHGRYGRPTFRATELEKKKKEKEMLSFCIVNHRRTDRERGLSGNIMCPDMHVFMVFVSTQPLIPDDSWEYDMRGNASTTWVANPRNSMLCSSSHNGFEKPYLQFNIVSGSLLILPPLIGVIGPRLATGRGLVPGGPRGDVHWVYLWSPLVGEKILGRLGSCPCWPSLVRKHILC